MRLKILKLALSGIIALSAMGAQAALAGQLTTAPTTGISYPGTSVDRARGGPEVPFPLSLEIPFPWNEIEGTWEAHGPGVDALFSFEVRVDYMDRKILKVVHLDRNNNVVATGIGIAVDDKRIVRAAMKGQNGVYMLFIRAFKNPKSVPEKTATVLTLRAFDRIDSDDMHVIVEKVSDNPYGTCRETPPTTTLPWLWWK
jgi:hypothetical protein